MKHFDLLERHALVTGGGTGIGLAIANRLAAAGAKVTICGRDIERLRRVAADNAFHAVWMDVTDEESVRHATEAAARQLGPINIHVANAGIAESQRFEDMSLEFWRRTLATNLDGAFLSIRESLRTMRQGNWGRIITIASVAGLRGLKNTSAYTVSKHGLVGLTRTLSEELMGSGITANAICPGYVDTPMIDRNLDDIAERTGKSREDALTALLRLNRDKRLIDPGEVAVTALWLCASGSEGVNGQIIPIAGGQV